MRESLKIMLVDDEESIQKVVEQVLKRDGYEFCCATNGEQALELFRKEQPSLIILDIMLPEIDGFEVCRIIRQNSLVPIIMLSAKNDIVDKTVGFNVGADDYLSKPFSPVELSLRVKALIRRVSNSDSNKKPKGKIILSNNMEIDCERYDVKVCGKKIDLTPKEFELLCFMAKHPGQVFTREQLLNQLWGDNYAGETGTITVFIRKIREKIELDASKPIYLQTVWGVGYKFCDRPV